MSVKVQFGFRRGKRILGTLTKLITCDFNQKGQLCTSKPVHVRYCEQLKKLLMFYCYFGLTYFTLLTTGTGNILLVVN